MRGLAEILIESARREGFPLAGVFDIGGFVDDENSLYSRCLSAFDDWIAAGNFGGMGYLRRGRAAPSKLLPGAKAILCVALPYQPSVNDPAKGPLFAGYLNLGDYHKEVSIRLERAMSNAMHDWTAEGHDAFEWRSCVDAEPLLEKALAAGAGLGFVGKNSLLITERFGSYVVLGEALINQEIGRKAVAYRQEDPCGDCRRCLEACPNGALVAPRVLDSRKCISYLTIEKKGGDEDRSDTGAWAAGCDLCQQACPRNQKKAEVSVKSSRFEVSWQKAENRTETEWREIIAGSALERTGSATVLRNIARACRNHRKGKSE
jgi:epoxyqueuosine reductase